MALERPLEDTNMRRGAAVRLVRGQGPPGCQQQLRHCCGLADVRLRDGGRKRLEKGQPGRQQPSAAAPAEVSALGRPDTYRLQQPVRQHRTQPAASPRGDDDDDACLSANATRAPSVGRGYAEPRAASGDADPHAGRERGHGG